jgi:2-polyprenyl-3-methyl-5-hydroxy-6-metoxy-1,4-benzoquinol methylase
VTVPETKTSGAWSPGSSRPIDDCPICRAELSRRFVARGVDLARCASCGLVLQAPQPSDDDLQGIYNEHYFLGTDLQARSAELERLKQRTAAHYLDLIQAYRQDAGLATDGLRLLEIGPGHGDLLLEARRRGFDVTGVEWSASATRVANERLRDLRTMAGSLDKVSLAPGVFDVCVMADVLEHVREPAATLDRVWSLLAPGGTLFVTIPTLDSWSARLFGRLWPEFKTEHLYYFNRGTSRTLLFQSGFSDVAVERARKSLSIGYIADHFRRFPVPVVTPAATVVRSVMPAPLRAQPFSVVASGVALLARRAERGSVARRSFTLSVIVPVFDEASTVGAVLEQLLHKRLDGVELEIIVVESHSTDGSREIAQRYARHPRVTLIEEPAPQGKGHAVRAGLEAATGDFVLIQDADLEYDIDDYERLLEPLLEGRCAFVLGARHGRSRAGRIREFDHRPVLALLLNVGHVLFRGVFNVLYRQRLHDPFTMYKVFRRDCLYGLEFECDHFDFDCELVAKLVRMGYRPIEIPVSYRSRSFRDGKKVSLRRDPPTWLRAFVKYRLQPVDAARTRRRRLRRVRPRPA